MELETTFDVIKKNFQFVQSRISELSRQSGRSESAVSLVAVTKTQPWTACAAVIQAGARIIGENRLQEAQEKFPVDFSSAYPGAETHFIGHLQKNKVRKVVQLFSCIQSVDDRETLALIQVEADKLGKVVDVFLEMNTSGEVNKHGCRTRDELLRLVETGCSLPALRLRGLMTIGPLGNNERNIRGAFAKLRELSEDCRVQFSPPDWGNLSMGMSGDYQWAIAEGSTCVRIGTALFGPRLDTKSVALS